MGFGKLQLLLGTIFLKLLGWQVVGAFPKRQSVIIIAPHTSNWDFVLFMLLASHWRVIGRILWMGKHTIFVGPFDRLLRGIGGMPVNRQKSNDTIKTIASYMKKDRSAIFVLAPEGTRKKTDHWKKGFYHIALGAQVPIALAFANYKAKKIGIGPTVELTGDVEKDWIPIRNFYQKDWARYPDNFSDMTF